MRKLLLIGTAVLLTATSASAQSSVGPSSYFGPTGGSGYGYFGPGNGSVRAINIDPKTGRTYARDADYVVIRKKTKRVNGGTR